MPTVDLSDDELTHVVAILGDRPYREVAQLILKIGGQWQMQKQAQASYGALVQPGMAASNPPNTGPFSSDDTAATRRTEPVRPGATAGRRAGQLIGQTRPPPTTMLGQPLPRPPPVVGVVPRTAARISRARAASAISA